MNAEITRYLDLLEQRILLLRSLSDALVAARTDIVSFDLDGLEARITDQGRLCGQIHSLDAHIDRLQLQCSIGLAASPEYRALQMPTPPMSDDRRLQETLGRLHETQARVKQLNDAHQVLLRRSRRTIGALLNSYHSFALTYPDPSSPCMPAGESL